MVSDIMPCFRDVLVEASYDDDIVGRDKNKEKIMDTFSKRIWEALNGRWWKKIPDDSEKGFHYGYVKQKTPSVVEKLFEDYGILIHSVDLRSINPPEGWRDTTLAPYKASREQDAAVHQAKTSAILFDDTNQALKTWLRQQKAAGHKPDKDEIKAKQQELHERALAKTGGYQQTHVKGLENAGTVVIGGGGTGFLVSNGGKGGKGGGGKKGGKRSRRDDDDRTDEEWFEDEFSEENEKNKKKGDKG